MEVRVFLSAPGYGKSEYKTHEKNIYYSLSSCRLGMRREI